MPLDNFTEIFDQQLNHQTPLLEADKLKEYVAYFLESRNRYLDIAKQKGSPLYLIDQGAIKKKAVNFQQAFRSHIPNSHFYYALKSNNHPILIKELIHQGFHVDVSSGKELLEACQCGVSSIIFSGPGKTEQELLLACQHHDIVTVLVDSFGELNRLESAALKSNLTIRAGVRLMIEENGLWRKFGIPLRRLNEFMKAAQLCRHVNLCGLQFHASWNLDAGKQINFLSRLDETLSSLDKSLLESLKFVDIGGGYWPVEGEWMQPSATTEGKLKQCIDPQITEGMDHRYLPSLPIDEYARQIAQALKEHLFKYINCEIFLEPGRWISHESMHILLQVIDKKDDDVIITDGGTNIIGWDRFEIDYFPLINLSRPSLTEHSCMVFGSLCTPHDLWGYNYFGDGIEAGDILLVPNQGAYTYSLRQEFIKPLPTCELI